MTHPMQKKHRTLISQVIKMVWSIFSPMTVEMIKNEWTYWMYKFFHCWCFMISGKQWCIKWSRILFILSLIIRFVLVIWVCFRVIYQNKTISLKIPSATFFSGLGVYKIFMNIMSCHGFSKYSTSTVILTFRSALVPYYLSKGFVIVEKKEDSLDNIPMMTKNQINDDNLHPKYNILTCTTEINWKHIKQYHHSKLCVWHVCITILWWPSCWIS